MKLFTLQTLAVVSLVALVGCQAEQESSNDAAIEKLLRSNEIQRIAHLENDAALLANEIADTMMSIQRGEISYASNQAIQQRFENYFKQVKYTSWDDTRLPIIQVSADGQMASVSVQKFLDLQYADEEGKLGQHNYALFAWNAQYALVDDQWKIVGNTSTDKSLTEEKALQLPIHLSEEYAEIAESDLIPEGIAHDNNTGTTYVSSTYKQKIVAIKADGSYSDFKTEREEGLWSTVGMEVDESNNVLWVVSFNGNEVLPMKYPEPETEWRSKIYAYHLPGGELIQAYEPRIKGKIAFNDLCVATNGKVYVSESLQNRVYCLDPTDASFTQLNIQDSMFIFPNGVTLSDDNTYLYIAVQSGIVQYKLEDQSHVFLQNPSGIVSNRIDGLAYYKGSLIANQSYRKRILQFTLDEGGSAITHQRILEANNPYFDQPATGEIAENSFIYLANTQMQSGFENGVLRDESELEAVKLLKVKLVQ